jgi:primary-amine oxidase
MRLAMRRLGIFLLAAGAAVSARAFGEEPPPGPADGQAVRWQGWNFRWAVRQREGLVLSDVWFRGRKVLKHAALAEIFVPYHPGEPRPEDALDGMGKNLMDLLPGRDCLPGTVCSMFDAEGRTGGRALVAMHEESTGLSYLGEGGRAYGKMLVLWSASKLGDYVYFIRWQFKDDGSLMPRVGLTGRLNHVRNNETIPKRGSVVYRGADGSRVFGPSHVHNFYYRLDFDVDGPENDLVEELNARQDVPGRSLEWQHEWTPLRTEGARALSAANFRSWRVLDKVSRNSVGLPRSYHLLPGGNGVFRGAAGEPFTQADFWVGRHRPNEFPLSSADPRSVKEALPDYFNGESVDGTDLVVWYVMHVHHVPRTEDWPEMPVEWAGLDLIPRDFLDASPVEPRKEQP